MGGGYGVGYGMLCSASRACGGEGVRGWRGGWIGEDEEDEDEDEDEGEDEGEDVLRRLC